MSLPYYGGMRHINVVPGSVDQACGEIRNLSDSEIKKVLDFIVDVKSDRQPEDTSFGSVEALMRHINTFSFNEGEPDELLEMVLKLREVGTR